MLDLNKKTRSNKIKVMVQNQQQFLCKKQKTKPKVTQF